MFQIDESFYISTISAYENEKLTFKFVVANVLSFYDYLHRELNPIRCGLFEVLSHAGRGGGGLARNLGSNEKKKANLQLRYNTMSSKWTD